jgi:hypothetical protein
MSHVTHCTEGLLDLLEGLLDLLLSLLSALFLAFI